MCPLCRWKRMACGCLPKCSPRPWKSVNPSGASCWPTLCAQHPNQPDRALQFHPRHRAALGALAADVPGPGDER
jgi:hypothetical protein